MTLPYKVDFSSLCWESPIEGVKHKSLEQHGIRMRLVEYSKEMPLHWCEKGHYGYVIDGKMEIEYSTGRAVYGLGDGVFIPDGSDHKHRGKCLTGKVLVFFIEKA